MTITEKLKMCVGCRDNFYNGNNPMGIKRCWNFASARVVKSWKIHWWTVPTAPGAFQETKTLSCHTEPGQYAFYGELPDNAVDPIRLGARR